MTVHKCRVSIAATAAVCIYWWYKIKSSQICWSKLNKLVLSKVCLLDKACFTNASVAVQTHKLKLAPYCKLLWGLQEHGCAQLFHFCSCAFCVLLPTVDQAVGPSVQRLCCQDPKSIRKLFCCFCCSRARLPSNLNPVLSQHQTSSLQNVVLPTVCGESELHICSLHNVGIQIRPATIVDCIITPQGPSLGSSCTLHTYIACALLLCIVHCMDKHVGLY